MRLLKRTATGGFTLTEDIVGEKNIPRYAILSHTWKEKEEVSFKEMMDGTGTRKEGYKKIKFCGDQAKRDGIQHFWVDTCCIDKSNSTELSEAINCMFRWYRNAAKCYVYLSDVSKTSFNSNDKSMFRKSRWWTRGWTLQELLAPKSVEFFSEEGELLGDRELLEQEIHAITGIAIEALQGGDLGTFDVEERFSWAENRQTTKEEDKVYSLLGLFGVYMVPIYGEGSAHAFKRLHSEIAKPSSPPDIPPNPSSTVPFPRDPDFVDRPDILSWIRTKCSEPGGRAALFGLGGVGKSQLAIQYSHDAREALPRKWVFWVHASTQARLEEAFGVIAKRLKLPGIKDPKVNIFQLVSEWLSDENNGKWTMVLDNADDIDVFFPKRKPQDFRDKLSGSGSGTEPVALATYLPQSSNGSILITSRSKEAASRLAGGFKNITEVLPMDESTALRLLKNKLSDPSNEDGATELVTALGYIPLAISQAASYINAQAPMTIHDFLGKLRSNERADLLDRDADDIRRDFSASNSIMRTWQMSFEHIRKKRRSAADLLSLMSFFNPQEIPMSIFRNSEIMRVETKFKAKADEHDTNGEVDDDFSLLRTYSLVRMTATNETCEMHALVQFCTKAWLSSFDETEEYKGKFLTLMAKKFPYGFFENWENCQQLLPHVKSTLDDEPTEVELLKPWTKLITNVSSYLSVRGEDAVAEIAALKAVKARERILGSDHEFTLNSMALLASIRYYQGKYRESEQMNRRVLEGYEKVLGKDNPETLATVDALAAALREQGKFDDAEKMIRKALEQWEKIRGIYHLNTQRSMGSLARLLQQQGKYADSEQMTRRVLELKIKTAGKEHPDTITILNNLAVVLTSQGKYTDAEVILQQAIEGSKKVLGSDHPGTLVTMSHLIVLRTQQGRYKEAEKLGIEVMEAQKKRVGPEHPDTLLSRGYLVILYQRLGQWTTAEELMMQVLEAHTRTLGVDHPDTITSMGYLASVWRNQGRKKEAVALMKECVRLRTEKLGSEHPHTKYAKSDLKLMKRRRRFIR